MNLVDSETRERRRLLPKEPDPGSSSARIVSLRHERGQNPTERQLSIRHQTRSDIAEHVLSDTPLHRHGLIQKKGQ